MFAKPQYTDEEKEKIYDEMARIANITMSEGKHVVVDATFHKAKRREQFLALAKDTKAFIILCTLSEKEIEKRIKNRKKGPSDADFEVYLKMKKEFEPVTQKHLEINVWNEKDALKKVIEVVGE
jgi:predicted kinase